MQMLNCRIALCDEINRIFGTDIHVEFSPLWKLEFEALVLRDTNGNGEPDMKEGDNNDDTIATDEPGGSSGKGGGETESEPEGTEEEPTETDTEPEEPADELIETDEPLDVPAMDLEETDAPDDPDEEPMTEEELARALGRE